MAKLNPAKKSLDKQADKPVKGGKKPAEKKGFAARGTAFFKELKAELKRVIWPDKEKMKQSMAIVLSIVVAAAVLIFVVDTIVHQSLNAAGFYTPKTTVATTVATALPSETSVSTESVVSTGDTTTETTVESESTTKE